MQSHTFLDINGDPIISGNRYIFCKDEFIATAKDEELELVCSSARYTNEPLTYRISSDEYQGIDRLELPDPLADWE